MELTMLERAYYMAELVGVVAIVATLIYLVIELRQNTKSVRLGTVHDISSLYISTMLAIAADKNNMETWVRGLDDFDQLDRQERTRFIVFMGVAVRTLSEQHFQWREGALDLEMWEGMRHVIDDFARYPGFLTYWRIRSHQYPASFQQYVADAIARAPTDSRPMYGEEKGE